MGNSQTRYTVSNGISKLKGIAEHQIDSSGSGNKRSKSHSNASSPYPGFLISLSEVLESKTLEDEKRIGVGEETFQKCICKECPAVGRQLYKYFLIREGMISDHKEDDNENPILTKQAFIQQAFEVLNLLTDSQQLEYYIKVYASDREDLSYDEFNELIMSSYTIAQFAIKSSCLPDNLLSAICKAALHGKDRTSCKYIFNWICMNCPRMVMWLHRYITHTLTVGYSTIPQNVPSLETDITPVLDGFSEKSCANVHPSLIWLLSCSLPYSFTKKSSPTQLPDDVAFRDPHKLIQQLILAEQPSHWQQLFSSDEHGLSVNRFQHHVFDYHGPTLFFVTTDDHTMFCVASDEAWKDSQHFYGGFDSICFQLYPEYKIIEKGSKILYFNISSRGFPTGLQVGTDSTNRALRIDIDFTMVHYRQIPYKILSLEVWGCGTSNVKEKQVEYKKLVSKDVENRRKVQRPVDWKDNPDRYLLEMAGARPDYARFEKETQNHS